VSPFRRGKELTCIYTDERPDLCRELPNWMFDQGYCAGMTLGPPEISIEGLNELAVVLDLFDRDRTPGAQSRPSKPREKGGAEQTASGSSAARPRAAASRSASAGDSITTGLVEALADLLLAALGMDVGATVATEGGVDERQDHA
jgi:hypothetical protein